MVFTGTIQNTKHPNFSTFPSHIMALREGRNEEVTSKEVNL